MATFAVRPGRVYATALRVSHNSASFFTVHVLKKLSLFGTQNKCIMQPYKSVKISFYKYLKSERTIKVC